MTDALALAPAAAAPLLTPVERAYLAAERCTAEWAKSFYFASRFLPEEKKRGIFAIYDFCRHADNLVDQRGDRPVASVRQELAELDAEVRHIHAGGQPRGERWLAFADTLHRYPSIPLEPLVELIEGVAMDLEPTIEVQTFPELERYCYLVAGVVGLMLGPLLGAPPETFTQLGVRLGIAMQLTNVLRDVAEDLDRGRIYLPAEEMARFGVTREMLLARQMTPELRRLMIFQVERARHYFEQGGHVVQLFPADGSRLTVRLLQQTYAGILDAIERLDYDVFRTRAFVSTPRKWLILGRAVWSERQFRALLPVARSA